MFLMLNWQFYSTLPIYLSGNSDILSSRKESTSG